MVLVELSEETLEKLKEEMGIVPDYVNSMEDFIGKKLFIRTVTYHLIGKVVKMFGKVIELERSSWIADSGRFMNAIKEGTLDEVEPLGTRYVNQDSIVDFGIWKHKLPTEQQ